MEDIREHGEEALRYLEGVSLEEFVADRRLQLQIERLMEIVGEAAGALSEQARADIEYDWRGVRGLRNVLSHQYGFVNHARLYTTVKNRVPELLKAMGDR